MLAGLPPSSAQPRPLPGAAEAACFLWGLRIIPLLSFLEGIFAVMLAYGQGSQNPAAMSPCALAAGIRPAHPYGFGMLQGRDVASLPPQLCWQQ